MHCVELLMSAVIFFQFQSFQLFHLDVARDSARAGERVSAHQNLLFHFFVLFHQLNQDESQDLHSTTTLQLSIIPVCSFVVVIVVIVFIISGTKTILD